MKNIRRIGHIGLSIVLFALFSSCSSNQLPEPAYDRIIHTNIQDTAKTNLVTNAQNWFNSIQIQNKNPIAIDWKNSSISGSWTISPLANKSNPFASIHKTAYRYLITHSLKHGHFDGRIIELALESSKPDSEEATQVALNIIQSVLGGQPSKNLKSISGWAIIYSPTYHYQTGLIYKAGVVQPQKIYLRQQSRPVTTSGRQSPATSHTNNIGSIIGDPSVCLCVTTCGTINGVDSGCFTYWICEEGGGAGDWGDGGSGGGGSGGSVVP